MFPRMFAWLRRHPQLVDLMWMLPLLAISIAFRARWAKLSPDGVPRDVPLPASLTLTAVMCVPLIWRRRWPRAVFALICLAAFVQWLTWINLATTDVAVFVVMYTVATQCVLRWSLAALAIVEAGMLMETARLVSLEQDQWSGTASYAVVIAGIWLSGMYVNTRRKYTLSLEERALRLERERDAQAEVSAASERARIARELHDVIAHSISVMVIQADGASYAVDTDTERAKRATQAIGNIGRQALTEMRRMLGVLREGDANATLAPQPGVEQLPDLIQQTRTAGLPVEYAVSGEPLPLPAGLELVVYRIAQEALTNVMKHAGPSATAHVSLDYGDLSIQVRVRDDGRGTTFSDGRGHGLVGMRERATVYGGEVRAAPVAGGGFEVVAWLPVKQEVKT